MDKLTMVLKTGREIKIYAIQGNKAANWSPSGDNYRVRVAVGNKSFSFDFWDSINNMQNGVTVDLRGALACWASDVFAGMDSSTVDDIASEFGYDKPSDAIRVFRGVKKAEKQYNRVGLTVEDLDELSDY